MDTDCPFKKLFTINVPHIFEIIFLSLDYESYKKCHKVCKDWEKLMTSESFREKGRSVFKEEISEDEYQLWNMAAQGNAKEVIALLSNGMVDVNRVQPHIHFHVSYGSTPLWVAAKRGHSHVVKLLLERGAEFDKPDGFGITPLHRASYSGHKDVVKVLLDAGADIDKTDGHGRTPLQIAEYEGYSDLLEVLTSHK